MANFRQKAFALTNGRCFYCGCKLDENTFHVDHFLPKSKGGQYTNNSVPSCPECNLCKGDLTIEEFRGKIGRYAKESFQGKILNKYFGIPDAPVKFFFETEIDDGTIQNNINEFLDRQ